MNDSELLRRYAAHGDEAAFRLLVERHAGLVHSAALRQLGGRVHLAQEISQMVFLTLARRAWQVARHPAPIAWLHRTTRHLALRGLRGESRRRRHETAAAHDPLAETTSPAPDAPAADWALAAPLLDEALDQLPAPDRQILLRRYFEQHSYRDIGEAVGVTENTARMRVDRARERLRRVLGRLGVRSSLGALALALERHAAAAPAPEPVLADILRAVRAQPAPPAPSWIASHSVWAASLVVALGGLAFLGLAATRPGSAFSAPTRSPAASPGSASTSENTSRSATATPAGSLASGSGGLAGGAADATSTKTVSRAEQGGPDSRASLIGWLADLRGLSFAEQRARLDRLGLPPLNDAWLDAFNRQHASPTAFGLAIFEHWLFFAPNELLVWAAKNFARDGEGAPPEFAGLLADVVKHFVTRRDNRLESYDRRVFTPSPALLAQFEAWGWGPDRAELQGFGLHTDPSGAITAFEEMFSTGKPWRAYERLAGQWPPRSADQLLPWARARLSPEQYEVFLASPNTSALLATHALDRALELLPSLVGKPYESLWITQLAGGLARHGRIDEALRLHELLPESAEASLPHSVLRPGMPGLDPRRMGLLYIAREWAPRDPEAALTWINSLADTRDFDAALAGAFEMLAPVHMRPVLDELGARPLEPARELAVLTALRRVAAWDSSVVSQDLAPRFLSARGAGPLARPAVGWEQKLQGDALVAAARFDVVARTIWNLARTRGETAAREWGEQFTYASETDRRFALAHTHPEALKQTQPGLASRWIEEHLGFSPP